MSRLPVFGLSDPTSTLLPGVLTRTGEPQTARTRPLAGLRTVIVLGPLELGGSERQALLFARYLKEEQGADVQIWGTMNPPGRLATLCDEHNIPWLLVPNPWVPGLHGRPKNLTAFARRLRHARAEVILPYMEMPNIVCGLVWRWTGARLCVWNQRDDGIARISSRYEPWAVRLTPQFIANSRQGADHLINTRGVSAARVHVVRNGVELAPPEAERSSWRNRLGIGDDCFVACMVANLTSFKDHATLLRAWRLVVERMKESGRRVALLLAGRFDDTHQSLLSLIDELDLGRDVRFLGEVTDVSGLLNASEVGVLCSNSEGSPNSALEYMAAGLAVAGTDIPAMREALPAESHEFLSPPRAVEPLAERLLKLAANAELRAHLGAANRDRLLSEYSPRRMCEQTLEVVVSGLRKPRRESAK